MRTPSPVFVIIVWILALAIGYLGVRTYLDRRGEAAADLGASVPGNSKSELPSADSPKPDRLAESAAGTLCDEPLRRGRLEPRMGVRGHL